MDKPEYYGYYGKLCSTRHGTSNIKMYCENVAHKMFFNGSERFGVPDLHYSFETALKYSLLRT